MTTTRLHRPEYSKVDVCGVNQWCSNVKVTEMILMILRPAYSFARLLLHSLPELVGKEIYVSESECVDALQLHPIVRLI